MSEFSAMLDLRYCKYSCRISLARTRLPLTWCGRLWIRTASDTCADVLAIQSFTVTTGGRAMRHPGLHTVLYDADVHKKLA